MEPSFGRLLVQGRDTLQGMPAGAPASKRYEDVRAWVEQIDPALAAAEAEVDVSLLEASALRAPLEMLRNSTALARELQRLANLPKRGSAG